MVARECIRILSSVAQVLLIGSLTLFWLQLLWGGWANSNAHHPPIGATAVVPPGVGVNKVSALGRNVLTSLCQVYAPLESCIWGDPLLSNRCTFQRGRQQVSTYVEHYAHRQVTDRRG